MTDLSDINDLMPEEEEDDTLVCPYCGETYESGKCQRCMWGREDRHEWGVSTEGDVYES